MANTHPPVEEYLQTIAFLIEEGVVVVQARIAERLGYSAQAISEAVTRLEGDGYLRRRGRRIELSDAGWAVAHAVTRRHRLAERLLVDVIGIPWSSAHREAGRYEHIISEQVEERLVAILGDPATCPHGNPIPGSEQPASGRADLSSLDSVRPGQQLRLERIPEDIEDDQDALEHLEQLGLLPGVVVTVQEAVSDEVVVLDVEGVPASIDTAVARRLLGVVVPASAGSVLIAR